MHQGRWSNNTVQQKLGPLRQQNTLCAKSGQRRTTPDKADLTNRMVHSIEHASPRGTGISFTAVAYKRQTDRNRRQKPSAAKKPWFTHVSGFAIAAQLISLQTRSRNTSAGAFYAGILPLCCHLHRQTLAFHWFGR